MKAFILLLLLLMAAPQIQANPWHVKTKHKTIKVMTKRQIRNAQKGKTLYVRHPKTGKVVKNSFILGIGNRQDLTVRAVAKDKRNPINYGR